MITCSMPLAIASSTPYWIVGFVEPAAASLWAAALVTGRKPRAETGRREDRLAHGHV